MRDKIRPQIFWTITVIGILAVTVIFVAPDEIKTIVGGSITGIGMLGMKLLEKE